MIPILTKKQAEEEKKRSKNLGWPHLPAIYKIPPRKKKVIFENIMSDLQRATIKGKVVHGKVVDKSKKAENDTALYATLRR